MKLLLGLLIGLVFLNTGTAKANEDKEKSFDFIVRCVGYLTLKVKSGELSGSEANKTLRQELSIKNLKFFTLAGGAIGKDLNISHKQIMEKFEEEYESWRLIMKVGSEREDMMPYGLLKAYEIECYEGGTIYAEANGAIIAAGLEQEAADIFGN